MPLSLVPAGVPLITRGGSFLVSVTGALKDGGATDGRAIDGVDDDWGDEGLSEAGAL